MPPTARPPLDPARLADLARWRVEVVPETTSTNGLVAARARVGEGVGLVVGAEHQTAGRGRLDRTWVTPPRAALTFSVLLRPAVPDRAWPWLPLLAGVAVCEGVREAAGVRCDLKWPNDVLLGGRKLAGILAERVESPAGPAAVLGIGLNVTQSAAELPVPGATSLLASGSPYDDRTGLLVAVLAALGRHLDGWTAAGGRSAGALAAAYVERCDTLGRAVRVALPDRTALEGRAVGIDDDGGLVVEDTTGRRVVSAGDVVHVRPVGRAGTPR